MCVRVRVRVCAQVETPAKSDVVSEKIDTAEVCVCVCVRVRVCVGVYSQPLSMKP